jgi:uncharacterized membrane protein
VSAVIVSLEALVLSTVVLISQNRQALQAEEAELALMEQTRM